MEPLPLPTHIDATVATARRWAAQCRQHSEPRAARLLADALADPGGLEFVLDFVDGVLRPEDRRVASRNLASLARRPVKFLPWPLRWGLRSLRAFALPALPVVRRAFAVVVGDLVVDFGRSLTPALNRLTQNGAALNVNLLGEAVLGDKHAHQRLRRTMALLERDDVDYVSIKVSSVLGPHAPFAHEDTVADAVERLRPLFRLAVRRGKFVNLDMEEYRDLHLTFDVFRTLLSEAEFAQARAGMAVQTYLRESSLLLDEIDRFAAQRVAAGGAPIKVRLVKGANLAMERVQAELRGWPQPTFDTKEESDASFLRALGQCLTPERTARVRIGIASHNIYSLAAAWEIAKAADVTGAVEIEMLSGMAVPLQRVVLDEVDAVRVYVPVVPRSEYDSAIAYLVRRLEENAAPENFMSGASALGHDVGFLDQEERRFRAACARVPDPVPDRWTTQRRPAQPAHFVNAVDTDPALPSNQAWVSEIRSWLPQPALGQAQVHDATVTTEAALEDAISTAWSEGIAWASVPAEQRAAALHRLGEALEARRGDLMAVAADEVGKLFDQSDVEVSEAVDFAHYYAHNATAGVDGARQHPPRITVVAPPWNFPIAIPLGGVAAALAVGSAVLLKPAPPARRIAGVLMDAIRAAGLPDGVVQLVVMDDGPLGEKLITDPRVEQVVLTGAAETAELFRSWRPALPLLAETSGKNAIVVTPSADIDLAVADLVSSAFGHAGQKCSAASLGILVGSVATSKRFRSQLLDAVDSLTVAWPTNPAAQIGPLTEEPGSKLHRGLTKLEGGQRWLIEPKQLDERLWRPGIRLGVEPGSEFHLVEYFGPVMGIMAARDLEEAIAWQNATQFGLTAGIHSLDGEEIQFWCDRIEAGNAYVNRSITGAIVGRQPFGGWKRSAVGVGGKAGGPNYLLGFGSWESDALPEPAQITVPSVARALRAAQALVGEPDAAFLAAAAGSDQDAMRSHYAVVHDPSALATELNALRYRPVSVVIRVEEANATRVCREALAAVAAGAVPRFSFTPDACAPELVDFLESCGFPVSLDENPAFDQAATGRVRYLGSRDLAAALGGSIDVTLYHGPTLASGRVALLTYLREQVVSVTNHRFGHPTRVTANLRL